MLAPHGSNEQDWAARLQGPSMKYLLGTDNLGRDLFSRIIYGAQISMIVGLAVPAISDRHEPAHRWRRRLPGREG